MRIPWIDHDTPPPLTDQDTLFREDPEWKSAAENYIGWKGTAEEAAQKADEAKAKLVALASHNRESGCGVIVTKFWKQGSVDYKKIPVLENVDLEQYRSKAKEEVRVTLVK